MKTYKILNYCIQVLYNLAPLKALNPTNLKNHSNSSLSSFQLSISCTDTDSTSVARRHKYYKFFIYTHVKNTTYHDRQFSWNVRYILIYFKIQLTLYDLHQEPQNLLLWIRSLPEFIKSATILQQPIKLPIDIIHSKH